MVVGGKRMSTDEGSVWNSDFGGSLYHFSYMEMVLLDGAGCPAPKRVEVHSSDAMTKILVLYALRIWVAVSELSEDAKVALEGSD